MEQINEKLEALYALILRLDNMEGGAKALADGGVEFAEEI